MSHITQLSNEIISDPSLSKQFDKNSKIFFLSNRMNDTLKRKALMDKNNPDERTKQISDFIEQINSEALFYAEEIFSTLLTELGIPNDIKVPEVQEKKEQSIILKKIADKKIELDQPDLVLHLTIVFGMVFFILWFHWMSV
ncbi:hypothetical protein PGH07_03190 [Sulfurovum sp. zt1-1]|uniref:Uncharacterized protein n=1 Tax=Sulfurovum zhangzhouensis TaxID=3019067 RepID=A0ABT7QWQ1_9BACT|nr:hypothetical protein [Sulfurovum zhangzhouensis]